MKPVGVGVIGCGNISSAYLKAAAKFPMLEIVALADLRPEAAQTRAQEFGLKAVSVDALLADPKVEIALNLTIPRAHVEVGLKALAAGKHVYAEKPLGVGLDEARELVEAAEVARLRLGSAPDTFLGGGQQTARRAIDEGRIGRPIAGTAVFMCPGHERWHPDPAFYYQKGGGPMLDMGPYYIAALVNLLGPIESVVGVAARARAERVIGSSPRRGERIAVEVATHVTGVLRFVCGAVVTTTMSFDVAKHRHSHIEIYGETGALVVPDPNAFGGEVEIAAAGQDWSTIPVTAPYADANYRSLGLADMAQAIRKGRAHRASGALAFHALEAMLAFQTSSDTGGVVTLASRPQRPAAMPAKLKTGALD
jgi:predicted dehydrogenase